VLEEDKNTYKRLKEFIKFVDSAFQNLGTRIKSLFLNTAMTRE
jgi:hypothetical protein